jgi:hypothetical protein
MKCLSRVRPTLFFRTISLKTVNVFQNFFWGEHSEQKFHNAKKSSESIFYSFQPGCSSAVIKIDASPAFFISLAAIFLRKKYEISQNFSSYIFIYFSFIL